MLCRDILETDFTPLHALLAEREAGSIASTLADPISPRKTLIVPARDGALRVLRAACRARVQRVVMTSAVEACRPPLTSPDGVSDERRWTDTNEANLGPYRLSKTLAERAAWDFMASQSGPTTLTTILPVAVFGPVFSAENLGSVQLISRLLNGSMPALPHLGFCVVDIRDVVALHIRAMTAPEAAGEHFIAAGDWVWWNDVAGVLRSALDTGAEKVPTRQLPDAVRRATPGSKTCLQFRQGADGVGVATASSGDDHRRLRPQPHCDRRRLIQRHRPTESHRSRRIADPPVGSGMRFGPTSSLCYQPRRTTAQSHRTSASMSPRWPVSKGLCV